MITWCSTALARGGMTPDDADEVLALAAQQEQDRVVQEWHQALPSATPTPTRVLHTAPLIRSYAAMAADLGYSVRQ